MIDVAGGTTYKGDGNQYRGSVTLGTGDLTKDKYNVFITLDGQHQDAIDYSESKSYIGTHNLDRSSALISPGTLGPQSGSACRRRASSATSGRSHPNGTAAVSVAAGLRSRATWSDGLCAWDLKDFLQIEPKTEKLNVLRHAAATTSPTRHPGRTPSFPGSSRSCGPWRRRFRRTAVVFTSRRSEVDRRSRTRSYRPRNPDNPYRVRRAPALRASYDVGGDVGAHLRASRDDTQRYLVGVKGTNWNWDWDAAVLYIRRRPSFDLSGYVNYPNLLEALNGRGGFGYYRVGANAGLNNPGIYGFIAPNLELQDEQREHAVRRQGAATS